MTELVTRIECKRGINEVIIVSGRIDRFKKSLCDKGVKVMII